MTNEEILKKAIEKAEKNGYYNLYFDRIGWKVKFVPDPEENPWIDCEGTEFDCYTIIFSHKFAKPFWGEKYLFGHCGKDAQEFEDKKCCWYAHQGCEWVLPAWQYHLQQMVIEPDPIKYLEKFL